MGDPKGSHGQWPVEDAREAYFAGQITAEEYLRRILPQPDSPATDADQLGDQFHRIRSRLARRQTG